MSYAPIVIFAYKRKDKLQRCIESLIHCYDADKSDVFIFCDGIKGEKDIDGVSEVRRYVESISQESFHSLHTIFRNQNLGLAKSIISGVSEVIEKYGEVIVVEDDLLLSRDFIMYMNDALSFYRDNKRYGEISAYTEPHRYLKKYTHDVYAIKKGECWGWATWVDRWENVDWNLEHFDQYLNNKKWRKSFSGLEPGLEEQLICQHNNELDAWAARWIFHLFNNKYLTIYPRVCRAINIGTDESGEHCATTSIFDNTLNVSSSPVTFEFLEENKKLAFLTSIFGMSFSQSILFKIKHFVFKQ